MHNIWNSFEIGTICRDFPYKEYLAKHKESGCQHKAVSEEGYAALWVFFNEEMHRDFNTLRSSTDRI